MSAVTVVARCRAKEGCESLMEKTLKEVVGPTHAEVGCIKYALHRSLEDARLFVLIECWTSKEAHDRHLNSPHIQALFKKLPGLVTDPPEIQVLYSVPVGLPEKLIS